mgnify:CR=1 FL=1
MYIYVYMYMYVCMYLCMYVCMYIYIYIMRIIDDILYIYKPFLNPSLINYTYHSDMYLHSKGFKPKLQAPTFGVKRDKGICIQS